MAGLLRTAFFEMKKIYGIAVCLSMGILACQKEIPEPTPVMPEAMLVVPAGFPAPVFPAGNELTPARWALGRKLFYDPVLSRDSTLSCASCHHADHAFSDIVVFSPGVGGLPGTRNAPTLANIAYHPYYTREGGVPTLEMQILVPVQEHNEFDFNILLIAERLAHDTAYVRRSLEAYGRAPDAFVITRSITCFERTFISGQSRYDQYHFQGKNAALTAPEKRGMDLFFSEKTNCSQCHAGFNFTNYAFECNGLYMDYPDPGRFRLTELESDRARFKVPTLRNVALTGPYMHDGSFSTLEAVVEHYNSGGQPHPNKSALVRPLGLTAADKADLVAFLRSLTDDNFVNNPKFLQNLPFLSMKQLLFLISAAILFFACNPKEPVETPATYDPTAYKLSLGTFPEPDLPADNPLTVQGVQLGRMLFYEKLLSKDGSQACADCHQQQDAFSDIRRFSIGVQGLPGNRQAMAVMNLAWHQNGLFWDGRAPHVRDQSLGPIQNPLEMNETLPNVVAKLGADKRYSDQFIRAFGDANVTSVRISLALEQFM
ncbi:MAG: cytochrome c peroxidase, partial [Saprospiraceae bacterium]